MHQRRFGGCACNAKAQSFIPQTVQLYLFLNEGLYLLEDLQRMNQDFPVLEGTVHPAGAAKKRDAIIRLLVIANSNSFASLMQCHKELGWVS